MNRHVFLDANILISAFDNKKPEAMQYMRNLLVEEGVALIISPLVRYEVLRGVAQDNEELHDELQNILNGFREINITRDIAELSTTLFRYAKSVGRVNPDNINKRSFDIFHWSTAKCNNLEIGSNDSDLKRLETLYNEYLAQCDKTTI